MPIALLCSTTRVWTVANSNGVTPGHLAAAEGHTECLAVLQDNGDINPASKKLKFTFDHRGRPKTAFAFSFEEIVACWNRDDEQA